MEVKMRDPNRIEETLEELKYYWRLYPDMRLGQLLVCITEGKDIFNIEDEELLKMLKDWNNKRSSRILWH